MDGNKTFIICGNFRGGTTAVAQILDRLGIPMGEDMDPNGNYEDLEFQQLLIHESVDMEKLADLIKKRNEKYATWGFKFPGTHVHMPGIVDSFRNPHVLFVFRDPYAVADSERRRVDRPLYEMMERTVEYNLHMTKLLQQLECPALPISFEQLLLRPQAIIDGLLDFVQVSLGWWDRRRLIMGIRLKKDSASYGYGKK